MAPQWQLWKINADGTGLVQFVDTPGYNCGSPDWSPNCKLVAYDTWPIIKKSPGTNPWSESQVAVVPADGSRAPRLLGPGAMPSWSPDGTQIVCHTYESPNTIVVMNADGTGRETIVRHWGSPRWSPRGNRIASIRDGGIALFDLQRGVEYPISLSAPSRNPRDGIVPYNAVMAEQYSRSFSHTVRQGFCISPDGRRYCYGIEDGGGLYLATLDEKKMHAVARTLVGNGTCQHASFAPDGKRIVFAWQPTGEKISRLCLLDVDSSDAPVQLQGQDRTRNNVNPDWSPDGKTIIFSSQQPP